MCFNGRERYLDTIEAFSESDEFNADHKVCELWLSVDDGPIIGMLRNGEHAWLMYLRFSGDAGFVTGSDGPVNQPQIKFTLSNGQVDEYPLSWCIPLEDCYKALAYFFASDGLRPEGIAWRES